MLRSSTRLALCVCVCAIHPALAELAAAQAPDPALDYHTLHTPHFDITYHDPLGELAQRLAVSAEHAHRVLTRSLQFSASQRTQILLTDEADLANGVAAVVPRNEIHLLAAAPEDLSPISDYDDWISTLITHEYTHILHLDQISGLSAVINAILGKTVAPNALQPRWFVEGLATYEETEHTSGGRLRSAIYEMYLRMDALEGNLPTLAALSNDAVRWPHGDLRYLYGARFVEFIARHFGEGALTAFGVVYGRQLLPYGLNRVATQVTGVTFVELYDRFRRETAERYRAERAELTATGLIEGVALTPHADIARSPRYVRDGRIVFYRDDGHSPPQLRTLDGEHLTETSGEAAFAPTPDGQSIVYGQPAPYRDLYTHYDLFRLDLATGQSERLTDGWRAREPDVAPSGRQIAYVTQAAGSSRLELAELADVPGTRRTLLAPGQFEQIFTPRFAPGGDRIAISVWRSGGYRDIAIVDVATGRVRELTRDRAIDSGPTFSPDGRRLYFSSDRSGIPNLYVCELETGRIEQVTRMLGGAFQPAVSPDGRELVFVDYGSRGYGLRRLPLPAAAEPAPAYADPRPARQRHAPLARLAAVPYSPLETILPQNYRLELIPGPVGQEVAVIVAGTDLARFHDYSLRYAQPLESLQIPTLELRYTYTRHVLAPSLRLFRSLSARRDLIVNGEDTRWTATTFGASASLSYRFAAVRRSQTLDFEYAIAHVGKTEPFRAPLDPNEPPPELPELGLMPSASFGYRYSDVAREAYDISASRGRSFGVRIDVTDPIMGRDLRTAALRWDLEQYLTLPWRKHHVLALRYAGGLGGGDADALTRFTVGGYPDDVDFPSIYEVAFFGELPALGGVALRGYAPASRSGTHYHQLQLEYRLPLVELEWGVYTLPFYLRRMFMTIFTDTGDAFTGDLEPKNLLWGAGAELFLQFVVVYRLTMNLRIGFARGLVHEGETQVYAHLGSPF